MQTKLIAAALLASTMSLFALSAAASAHQI